MIRPTKDLANLQPPRHTPPPDMAQFGGGKPAQAGTQVVVIKWDSTRTGKRYNGHLWLDGGTQGDAVQFRFVNDVGTANLLDANDYVLAIKCPTWDEGNACWSGTDAKYWAILSPWAAVPT